MIEFRRYDIKCNVIGWNSVFILFRDDFKICDVIKNVRDLQRYRLKLKFNIMGFNSSKICRKLLSRMDSS